MMSCCLLQPGDRVGAFHEMLMPGGSYAEYAVAWSHTTFHLPEKISFEGISNLFVLYFTFFHC